MPTYNEMPGAGDGRLAGDRGIAGGGRSRRLLRHLHPVRHHGPREVWIEEEAAFLALRQRLLGGVRLFYRRRAKNTERKAGNVAEWVRRFGAAYPQMITLDADSVMEGASIVRLAAAMEAHPASA